MDGDQSKAGGRVSQERSAHFKAPGWQWVGRRKEGDLGLIPLGLHSDVSCQLSSFDSAVMNSEH